MCGSCLKMTKNEPRQTMENHPTQPHTHTHTRATTKRILRPYSTQTYYAPQMLSRRFDRETMTKHKKKTAELKKGRPQESNQGLVHQRSLSFLDGAPAPNESQCPAVRSQGWSVLADFCSCCVSSSKCLQAQKMAQAQARALAQARPKHGHKHGRRHKHKHRHRHGRRQMHKHIETHRDTETPRDKETTKRHRKT